ncbi:unnamed protein product [Urochloa decumbens]|uniref:DUF4220 domain-containing protein n=1 Tax=Urochloa decumbens TaxID=240449 RepID=A0ABC9FJN8_9POAL
MQFHSKASFVVHKTIGSWKDALVGATTLFLPILSFVVSNGSNIASSVGTLGQLHTYFFLQNDDRLETLQSSCHAWAHLGLILLWANLVQIIEMNTCAIVAADHREGRSISPPMVLAVQVIWTSYLAVYNAIQIDYWFVYTFLLVLALVFTKMMLKYFAFQKAKHSFALGRNPRLIVGYMEQLQEKSQHAAPIVEHLPPLIVMGEDRDRQLVEKHPRGYRMKWIPNKNGITNLVTIDKIWQLDDMLSGSSVPRIKDICFSFALFKMLRCLFAGYRAAEAGLMEAHNFFWHVLLKDNDVERLFGVFEDELSFLHDYYYSSFPMSYSKSWLPISTVLTSLLTIIYCLLLGLGLYLLVINPSTIKDGQITCFVWCNNFVESPEIYCDSTSCIYSNSMDRIEIGNIYLDLVPVFVLLALVVLSEIKDSASYICSNWTKVALTCRYIVSHENRQQSSPKMQRWVSRLLQCRFKFMKHWDDKMNQSSLFQLLHQKKTPVVLLKRLFRLPDQQKKNVKVPRAVKVAIVESLKRSNGVIQTNYSDILRRGMPDGDNKFLWACSGEGTVDIILIWHIATTIVEIRYSQQPQSPVPSDNKIVATHLSQYCAYLVAYVPGLLPDDDPWCKKLYKAVKDDFTRVLSGSTVAPTEYEQVVALLTERSDHEVLKKGVRLGKQLAAESEQEEEMVWRLLAEFWSALILSVAPSGRLDEHAEAIARGGELVTLLWALLLHAGTGPSAGPAWSAKVRV